MIDPVVSQFLHCAVTAPSADNSQPWEFLIGRDSIFCQYQSPHSADLFGEMGHASLVAGGALQETIDTLLGTIGSEASECHLDGGWQIKFPIPRIDLPRSDIMRDIKARHTNRFPFSNLSTHDLNNLLNLAELNHDVRVLTDRTAIREIGRAVLLCSEARFNSQQLHEWLFSSIRWTAAEVELGDGLDVATLSLPPGGTYFMKFIAPWHRMSVLNLLGVYKLLAFVDSQPVSSAPALIGIAGPATPSGAWNAGRLLQRLWIRLNAMSLAVHPYYVVTDMTGRLPTLVDRISRIEGVETANRIARQVFQVNSDRQLHMLLRIGRAVRNPTRSRRKAPVAIVQES